MNELELCVKSNVSFDKLIEIMKDKGFHVQEDFQMNDIYMIGKTLYYLFSSAKDVSNIRNEYVSPQIANIVDLCTRNDPNDRTQSVNDIIGLLHEYKSQIMAVRNAPKRIKEIKQNYRSGSPEFNEEVYKSLKSNGNTKLFLKQKFFDARIITLKEDNSKFEFFDINDANI